MNADGSDQRLVAQSSDQVAWSPDGRELVVAGDPKGEGEHLYIIDPRGQILRRLTAASGGLGLTWAPGKRIAYVYDRGNSRQSKCGD